MVHTTRIDSVVPIHDHRMEATMRARTTTTITLTAAITCSLLPGIALAAEEGSPRPLDGEPWIAYNGGVGAGSGIRLVRPDGSGDHAPFDGLTGEAWHADWSRDGRSIAFAVDDTDGTRDLWIGAVDGSGLDRRYDCTAPCSWADDPAWSPDGTTILFQQGAAVGDEGLGVGTIEMLDVGTGTTRTIASGGPGEYFYVPRWAPDGRSLVVEISRFASALLSESEVLGSTIATVDVDTAAIEELVPDTRRATYPDWSPSGTHIVFQAPVDPSRTDGPLELYVVPAGGGDASPLTSIGADGRQALQPSWTPDGKVIFVEQDGMFENVRMAVVGADGSGLGSATGDIDLFGTHPRLRPAEAAAGDR
jgi:Tol biopolymer transport system component